MATLPNSYVAVSVGAQPSLVRGLPVFLANLDFVERERERERE